MTEPSPSVLADALAASGAGTDLESVTRPLLEALEELTGLTSTYLTRVDWDAGQQHIVYARNTGDLSIPEGLAVDWADTLCRRAMESGMTYTDAVPDVWSDSEAAAELGIQSYVSSPVTLPDGEVYGTLCGASTDRVEVDERTGHLLQVFSRIIADALMREQARRAAEMLTLEAEERLRARARFLAVAEHKLKGPITVVRGWATTLQQRALTDEQRAAAVAAIASAADRLGTQVEELLEEASSQVVATELAPAHLPLAPLVREVAGAHDAAAPDHAIEVDISDDLAATVDERALRVVLDQLLENAVAYSPGGGPIEVTGTRTSAGRVALSVRDHGIGLPDDVDIFAPFVRGAPSTIDGTGLGLHIVSSLAHAMGGDVTAASHPTGASFTVVLPG